MTTEKRTTRRTVALRYQAPDAPKVVAKGFDELAEEIVRVAKENGVLVHEDEKLVSFLARLDMGQEVPDVLYHVIAELIAFSYVLQGKFPEGWDIPPGHLHTQA